VTWLFLAAAILLEVGGTLCLRMASTGRRVWIVGTVVGYVAAFGGLTLALAGGMPLGVAYGIWAATGVALVAVAGRVLFEEPFTWVMGLGVVLIIGGVLLVETGAAH
jgi:small multidrug resistance pump